MGQSLIGADLEGLQKAAISVASHIVVEVFRVDDAAVAQDIADLAAHHGMVAEITDAIRIAGGHGAQGQFGAGILAQDVVIKNLDDLVGADLAVADTRGAALMDNDQRLQGTEAQAPYFNYPGFYILFRNGGAQTFQYIGSAGGEATRGSADEEYGHIAGLKLLPACLSIGEGFVQ